MQKYIYLSLIICLFASCGDLGNYDLQPIIKIINENTCQFQKKLVNINELNEVIENYKTTVPQSKHNEINVFLTIPKNATMGAVYDVKAALRRNNILNITVNTEE